MVAPMQPNSQTVSTPTVLPCLHQSAKGKVSSKDTSTCNLGIGVLRTSPPFLPAGWALRGKPEEDGKGGEGAGGRGRGKTETGRESKRERAGVFNLHVIMCT